MNRIKHILSNWFGINTLSHSIKALQWKVETHRGRIETLNNSKAMKSDRRFGKETVKSDIKALEKRIELLESLAFTGDDNHANWTN